MKRYEKSSLHGLVEKYSMVLALHKHWINNINEFGVCLHDKNWNEMSPYKIG